MSGHPAGGGVLITATAAINQNTVAAIPHLEPVLREQEYIVPLNSLQSEEEKKRKVKPSKRAVHKRRKPQITHPAVLMPIHDVHHNVIMTTL